MKFSLPTENWNDLFGFLRRRQLGELVHQIGDWYFATKAQFYLHECGQITLAYLTIKPSENDDDDSGNPIVHVVVDPEEDQYFPDLPLADVSMPTNVKNFQGIRISYFDESVLNFLKEFQRNSLLHDVHLVLGCMTMELDVKLAIVTNILPFTNIKSVDIRSIAEDIMDLWRENENELGNMILASANVLRTHSHYLRDDWLHDWFFTPREDGMPRILRITVYNDDLIPPFIGLLKKEFLEAKKAVTFFIHFKYQYWLHVNVISSVQSLILDNGQTNEKLVIERKDAFRVAISRYPIGSSEEWIREMAEKPIHKYRNIIIDDF